MTQNRQWIYARKPASEVGPENFDLREGPAPEPKAGEVLVRTTLLSLDPASRAWMQGATYRSQLNPGDVMAGWGLGEVVSSNAKGFEPGDLVSGEYGWQQYAALPARALTKHDKKHKPEHILGALGITGLTAYFGMLDVGRPRPGETVLVSGAAGAVGSIAGQIAKISGCRVVGTTRGADKCKWIVDALGFDAAIDYQGEKSRQGVEGRVPERSRRLFRQHRRRGAGSGVAAHEPVRTRRLLRRDLAIRHRDAVARTVRRAGLPRHQAHPHGRLRGDGFLTTAAPRPKPRWRDGSRAES